MHGTKNSERRQIPIVEPMARLLQALQDGSRRFRDPARQRQGYILGIRECQKAIDRASYKLGLKRITHHDLRHYPEFRTIAGKLEVSAPNPLLAGLEQY